VRKTIMTMKRDTQHCHADELRSLVLTAIPELRATTEGTVSPHPLMRGLFEYTTNAISRRDVPTVIRCFRLTNQLIDLGSRSDSFVRSAVWVSYINRFQYNDPVALDLFHQLDPDTRATLYSPFTFPHTWLREQKLTLPGSNQWRSCVTIANSMETEARFVRQQTCSGHFAIIRVRVEPMLEDRSVLFQSRLDDAEDVPLYCVEAVIEGIGKALVKRCDKTRGVSYLRIELLTLRYHPVDSRSADFMTVGEEAVDRCFKERGIVEL